MSKRLIQFDILRVMAMIFVIAIHVSVRPFVTNPYMKNMWYVLFLVCNGLFYMLSGKFNLRMICQIKCNTYDELPSNSSLGVLYFMHLRGLLF
ncbi:hypothetical protein, partial [Sharpea azabuensis]|uniref:hypothetical protein n=1 Tax=Sharpea azabuensis TaxID=322505 RepID=UPI0023F1EA5C